MTNGPALLLTHGCQLDKRGLSRLQFAPLLAVDAASVTPSNIGQLRNKWLTPPEGIYIDDVGDGQPAIALLGQGFMIPATYFALDLVDFTDNPESDPEQPFHAVARANDDRTVTMEPAESALLEFKMAAYWIGLRLTGAPER